MNGINLILENRLEHVLYS